MEKMDRLDAVADIRYQLEAVLALYELIESRYFSRPAKELVEQLKHVTEFQCNQLQLNLDTLFNLIGKAVQMAQDLERKIAG